MQKSSSAVFDVSAEDCEKLSRHFETLIEYERMRKELVDKMFLVAAETTELLLSKQEQPMPESIRRLLTEARQGEPQTRELLTHIVLELAQEK